MKTLNDDEKNLVLGALDSLGVALTDHGHTWTTGERAIYEEAVGLLDGTPRPAIPAGLPKCGVCNWHHELNDSCPPMAPTQTVSDMTALEIIVDLLWVHDRPKSVTGAMGRRMVDAAKAFVRRCSDRGEEAEPPQP